MGLEEEDIFEEHRISETIRNDLNQTLGSQQVNDFIAGLEYKSQKTKEKDLAVIELLVSKLRVYAKGWITCNFKEVGELYNKAVAFDKQKAEFYQFTMEANDALTGVIIALKKEDLLTEKQLDALRGLERIINKLK